MRYPTDHNYALGKCIKTTVHPHCSTTLTGNLKVSDFNFSSKKLLTIKMLSRFQNFAFALLLTATGLRATQVLSANQCNSNSSTQAATISLSVSNGGGNSQETFSFVELKPELLLQVKTLLQQESVRQEYLGETAQHAANSCNEIHKLKPCKDSDTYWVKTEQGVEQQYCNFDTPPAEWRLLINVDMKFNDTCPEGLELVNPTHTNNKRLCKGYNITLPTGGVPYNLVKGRVIGYQFSTTNAFGVRPADINGAYVDGISITHGRTPRHHIWTYAAGYHNNAGRHACPCTNPSITSIIPDFVGNDYYCDIAPHGRNHRRLYLENALWDGKGCASTTTCCDNPNLPWFENKLPHSTSDDIDLRILTDEGRHNEDIYVEVIQIFVK